MEKATQGSIGCPTRLTWLPDYSQPAYDKRIANSVWLMARTGLLVTCLSWIAGCGTLSSTERVTVSRDQPFALLAFENLSATPQADARLRALLETRLRRSGVSEVFVYTSTQPSTLKALLDARLQTSDAKRWAVNRGARYALSGSVHEWQYQNGANSEPTVGITLSLLDLKTDKVLWQGNAARSGLGYANLSTIADKTISELLSNVTFARQRIGVAHP